MLKQIYLAIVETSRCFKLLRRTVEANEMLPLAKRRNDIFMNVDSLFVEVKEFYTCVLFTLESLFHYYYYFHKK